MTSEKVFTSADDFFQEMHQDISSAQKNIYLETYIFDQDKLGYRTLAVLADAAERGVKVQLLIDGVGSAHWTFNEAEIYRSRGIDLQFFHPLAWQKQTALVPPLLIGTAADKCVGSKFVKAEPSTAGSLADPSNFTI